jgi:hypothetical protein
MTRTHRCPADRTTRRMGLLGRLGERALTTASNRGKHRSNGCWVGPPVLRWLLWL